MQRRSKAYQIVSHVAMDEVRIGFGEKESEDHISPSLAGMAGKYPDSSLLSS